MTTEPGLVPPVDPDLPAEPGVVAPITYAQNLEDVRLWKALRDEPERIYVDVGAGHPVENSVTKLFFDRGWRGVNVEPGPNIAALRVARPRDVNLHAAVSASDGVASFYIAQPYPDLSSLHREFVEADADHVDSIDVVEVPTMRLDTVVSTHVRDEPVAFLKVDVEGAESAVLGSADWRSFRPVVVMVESIAPVSHRPTHGDWEESLLQAGYVFADDDGINRFYARSDRLPVVRCLARPVSPIDGFVAWPLITALNRVTAAEQAFHAAQDHLSAAAHSLEVTEAERDEIRAKLDAASANARQLMLAALNGDRVGKETSIELRGASEGVQMREEVIAALAVEAARWKAAAAGTKATWSYRLGHHLTTRMGRLGTALEPGAARALKHVRLRRSRPDLVRRLYEAATADDRPLRTTAAVQRSSRQVARRDPVVTPGVEAVWRDLAASRGQGVTLLRDSEFDELRRVAQSGDSVPLSLRLLAELRDPVLSPAPTRPTTLVVDIRGAQFTTACGVRTHALNVLADVLEGVPSGIRVCYIADPVLPHPAPDLMERFDDAWSGSLLGEVGSFLQLAPLAPSHEFNYGELLRAPWVRKASVWLDAIPALTPDAFFSTANQFFDYLYILETLARFDCLLALSQSSADELTALGFEGANVVITGCRGSFEGGPHVGRPPGLPFDRFVVAVGNGLPHKNLAAAAAGFVRSWAGADTDLGLVVAANVSHDQAAELETLAAQLGLEPHRVVVRQRLPDEEFCQLISAAEAVIVPSFHEGFSMPVIEATRLGTPLVLSDIPAHRELLGRGPWSFNPADPSTLSRALSAVMADPAGTLARQQSRLRATHDAGRLRRSIHRVVGELCKTLEPTPPRRVALAPRPSNGSRSHISLCKVCELEDFRHARLQHYVRDIFAHELARFGDAFPAGKEYRKYWEIAMAVMAFDAGGLFDGSHRFLGVGAGNESTIFHLTRHAESVLATDLYLDKSPWDHSANGSMLTDPGAHWPLLWIPERLEVRHMDALKLELEDESFGGVFSSSSIEHFGDRYDAKRAIDEVFRVLEPGGIFSVSSEFRLGGARREIPGALLFDIDDVQELFVGMRDWKLVEPFDTSISEETMASAMSLTDAVADQLSQVDRLGGLWQHHITYRHYPHLVLRAGESTFTSFHLALRKAD